jgi:hypothetical protein
MPNLMPSDITDSVANVLRGAARGDGSHPNYLTAYQILDRLPEDIRDRLIGEPTLGGHGAGVSYAAPSVVSDAAEMLPGIIIDYIDNRGIEIHVAGQALTPGFEVCGIYRLPT